MSVRGRSWLGAVMTAIGALLMIVAMLTAKAVNGIPSYSPLTLWSGVLLLAGGIGMILWALAGAVRQIGASEATLEARLRAEAEARREPKR
jgi:hypothetical protein